LLVSALARIEKPVKKGSKALQRIPAANSARDRS
jgi:hypothetical protein